MPVDKLKSPPKVLLKSFPIQLTLTDILADDDEQVLSKCVGANDAKTKKVTDLVIAP